MAADGWRGDLVAAAGEVFMATSGELSDRLRGGSHGRRQLSTDIGLAVPGRPIRSLVAEDRSAGGVRDRAGPEPLTMLTVCSRDLPTPAGTAQDTYPWGRDEDPGR